MDFHSPWPTPNSRRLTVAVTVPFSEALKVWARIGCLSFGGPAGQIALMHREIVEERLQRGVVARGDEVPLAVGLVHPSGRGHACRRS